MFLILINSIEEMHSFMKVNYCAVIHHLQEDRRPVFKPITLRTSLEHCLLVQNHLNSADYNDCDDLYPKRVVEEYSAQHIEIDR